MTNRAEPIARCPYCKAANEFRPMAERIAGWFRCKSCGHNAMPLGPEFKCVCSKCATSRSRAFSDWFSRPTTADVETGAITLLRCPAAAC